MQVTLSSLRLSSTFAGMVKRKTITCPEFVPAHNVGEVVVAVNLKVVVEHKNLKLSFLILKVIFFFN